MEFLTQRNRPPRKGEINSGETLVDTSGFIPPERQIFDMINAGRRLSENRKGMYEFERTDKVPDDYIDPTREPGFDMVDAGNIADLLTRKRQAAEAVSKKEAAEKARQDAKETLRKELEAEKAEVPKEG